MVVDSLRRLRRLMSFAARHAAAPGEARRVSGVIECEATVCVVRARGGRGMGLGEALRVGGGMGTQSGWEAWDSFGLGHGDG